MRQTERTLSPDRPPRTTDPTAVRGLSAGTVRARGPALLRTASRLFPLALALALWAYSLPRVDFRQPGEFGLLDRFPVTFYAAPVLLTGGFLLTLRKREGNPWLPGLYTVALIAVLKATPAVLYDTVRYAWAWKHDSVITHLLANGRLHTDPAVLGNMSPYDQWPGFFSLNGLLVRAFGVENAAVYANWAPFVLGLLMLPPLLLVYRTFSRDRRLVWTAVWVFQLGNWVGQDYLAPQGFAYLIHLTVLAVVLRHFVRPGSVRPPRGDFLADPAVAEPPPATGHRRRAALVLLLLPLLAAIDASHQLTPVMLIIALAALCLTRRYRNFGLLASATALMLLWNLTVGRPLFLEQLGALRDTFGDFSRNSRAGYTGELTGRGAELVGQVNTGMVLVIAALAGAAVLVRRDLTRGALPLLLVTAAPVPLLVANDYGGEMLFRVYLFALPGAAFFAAAALVAAPGRFGVSWRERLSAVMLPAVVLGLLAGFLPSYYGKERMHHFRPGEAELVQRMYESVPDGSLILAATGSFPEAYRDYDAYRRWWFAEQSPAANAVLLRDPVDSLAEGIPEGTPAYVVLTEGQRASVEMEGLMPPGGFESLERALSRSPEFRVMERTSEGVVMEYVAKRGPE